tara:strand:+ start:302 stop:478 length:177 start_codon:yes stop_codon:yes gene_type:complete
MTGFDYHETCDQSTDAYSVQVLSIVLTSVFGAYILFDSILAAYTVGVKAYDVARSAAT